MKKNTKYYNFGFIFIFLFGIISLVFMYYIESSRGKYYIDLYRRWLPGTKIILDIRNINLYRSIGIFIAITGIIAFIIFNLVRLCRAYKNNEFDIKEKGQKLLYGALRIIVIILLINALGEHPYSYYNFLRLMVFLTAGYGSYLAYKLERKQWIWILGISAFIFNPILPIHLSKDIWGVIDILMAFVLFISFFTLRNSKNRNEKHFNSR